MDLPVTCRCGNVLWVEAGLAGLLTLCPCGLTVEIPSLSSIRQEETPSPLAPQTVADLAIGQIATEGSPRNRPIEALPPTELHFVADEGRRRARPVRALAAMTAAGIEIQEVWRHRSISLQGLRVEKGTDAPGLTLKLAFDAASNPVVLTFSSDLERDEWYEKLQSILEDLAAATAEQVRRVPEGVSLVSRSSDVTHEVIGWIEYTGLSGWAADRGLQLRAGASGADAVIRVERQKRPEIDRGARQSRGLAIRVEDADARRELRWISYSEAIASLFRRQLLLVLLMIGLLLLYVALSTSARGSWLLEPASEETPAETIRSGCFMALTVGAWPLAIVILLRLLRWPQLIRAAALGVLAISTGRGLAVWAGHLLAGLQLGLPLSDARMGVLIDPLDWAVVIAGIVLYRRAHHLSDEARQLLPREALVACRGRKTLSRGLFAISVCYGLLLIRFVGWSRYEASSHVLQPGVDVRREREALQVQREAEGQLDRNELGPAEESLRRALVAWEGLTARKPAPMLYLYNRTWTLDNLGWVHHQQGRLEEAEKEFARALESANEPVAELQSNAGFQELLAHARKNLVSLRDQRQGKAMEERHRAAGRDFEEAEVRARKGESEAEGLFERAITTWEELIRQTVNEEYRRSTLRLLASACTQLGELQMNLGRRASAEASLKKAIAHAEKAVASEPDRPWPRHTLEVAQSLLEDLGEEDLEDRLNRCLQVGRFADAASLQRQAIDELEKEVRTAPALAREPIARRLALRLDRCASFLMSCPDRHVRSARDALTLARRACELQPQVKGYRFTLAMAQYRNREWAQCVTTTEAMGHMEGGLTAGSHFLSAMALSRLDRASDARSAYQNGIRWIDERRKEAMNNDLLRFQLERILPSIETLRREAESLLEGKSPDDRDLS